MNDHPRKVIKQRFLNSRIPFPWRGITGGLLLILSVAVLAVLAVNPLTYLELEPVFPIYITSLGGGLYLERAHIALLYGDPVVWGSALGAALLTLAASFLLLVRNTIAAIKGSPLSLYRKIVGWRNWLLAKVEYLQTESAKWKTTFNILKSPYSLLRTMGFSPQMAISFLVAGSAVGGGVVVNETVFAEKSFSRGDPGIYMAPIGIPIFSPEEFNTLRVDLGATSVGMITIENISLGTSYTGSTLPSGETNVVIVGGLPTVVSPAFTETYLEVGTLYIDRWRCETLTITNSEIHDLLIKGNASDGQSISAVAGTPRDRGINGGNRADDMVTTGGYYDQLKITSASSGVNGQVDVLKLTNLYSKGGGCVIDRVKAGTMEITLNEVGGDSDLATKAFTVATSVIYKSFTNDSNVEVSMAVPAVQ
tara:strand:- start:105 stop:1370 length:1266 start_codon:yes stop_codon:yes gene_type:complete